MPAPITALKLAFRFIRDADGFVAWAAFAAKRRLLEPVARGTSAAVGIFAIAF